MSNKRKPKKLETTERIGGGGIGHGTGMVGQKAENFGPTIRRLMGMLGPERIRLILVISLSLIGVALSSFAPRVLGRATDLLFAGIIGRQVPEGLSRLE